VWGGALAHLGFDCSRNSDEETAGGGARWREGAGAAAARFPTRGEAMPANLGRWKLQGGLEEGLEASTGHWREWRVKLSGGSYGGAAERLRSTRGGAVGALYR
jgi:hypothetical protein